MKLKHTATIISTSYFPSIKYFQCFNTYKSIYIEYKEYYKRHSIRNRSLILGANGPLLLTVPIRKKKSSKTLIENIKIANNEWKKKHINSIKSAYGSAPFFIYYFDQFQKIINKNHAFLIDLNYEILEYLLTEFKINANIQKTQTYIKKYSDHCIDQREELIINKNLKTYTQVFEKKITPNLSIIDLLFNLGPNAKKYI